MNAQLSVNDIGLPPVGEATIIDDYVPVPMQAAIAGLMKKSIWGFGWKSAADNDDFGFWHTHFAGGDTRSLEDCEGELLANQFAGPVVSLWKHLSSGFLAGHTPIRVYANAHTYGVEGYIHTDSDRSDCFTTIYYAHERWEANWAGETAFFSPVHGNINLSVHPSPGRLVFFRGVTPHVGRSPSRKCPDLRIALVFKTRFSG